MYKAAVGIASFQRTGIRLNIKRSRVQNYPVLRVAPAMTPTSAVVNPTLWARLTFTWGFSSKLIGDSQSSTERP